MIGISLICTTSFPQSSPIHSCIRMVHTVAVVLLFCHSCYHDRPTESLNINSNKFEFIYWLGRGRYTFTMKKFCWERITKYFYGYQNYLIRIKFHTNFLKHTSKLRSILYSIWMDLCTHGLVDCCFYRGCLHSFIFVDREMCCCYNWCTKFQPHTHKCINTYYVNWKVLTIHLLPQERTQPHF